MNRRKIKKQGKLRHYQYQSVFARYADCEPGWEDARTQAIMTEMEWSSPYEIIDQDRHEKRVFGHSVLDCPGNGCTLDKIEAAVAWNQPPKGWAGGGHEHHRRMNNRKKRR